MRETLALMRAGWLTALSYRLNLLFSLMGLVALLVPVYFVAHALQPVAAASIAREGGQYFGFLVVGLSLLTLISTTLLALPGAIGGAISSGTLEALLATPARLPAVLLGLVGYDLAWSALRAVLLVGLGIVLGTSARAAGVPLALVAVALTLACYFGISLMLGSMILVYRTVGPLGSGLVAASALLGGVYYSTSVIPSWVQHLSVLVPLTYGLRVIRQALLSGAALPTVQIDLLTLGGLALGLLGLGAFTFLFGLRHARREGTLGQY
jgi:ABC-2 type transport system permease protein